MLSKEPKMYFEQDNFIIENYNNAKPFASFLPSISGIWGKPMWVFYVNRGQCISSLGTKDKNGAILEFVAANKAYRFTSLHGFRTFLKINGSYYEPFQNFKNENLDEEILQRMYITSYILKLQEINKKYGLEFEVEYFTIPYEKIPSFVRIFKIKNISNETKEIECLDGLPMIIPYGISDIMLKNISRLAEGWYSGVVFLDRYTPIYKLIVEPEDRPEIIPVEKGNFYCGFLFDSSNRAKRVDVVVDPDIIFGPIKDFLYPKEFLNSTEFHLNNYHLANNKTPCGMGFFKIKLLPDKDMIYISVLGNVSLKREDVLKDFIRKLTTLEFYNNKKQQNHQIIEQITNSVYTKSYFSEFDNYCRQTFLDNILRGGYPIEIGKNEKRRIVYIYSRIHGDMEREYNNFVIMPEYFSQGNGHYRDVLQNRRNDIFFKPQIGCESIVYFLNLLQLDGYNPMLLMGSSFKINKKNKFLKLFAKDDREKIKELINKEFTLGEFFNFIEENNIKLPTKKENFVNILIEVTEKIDNVYPHQGFWSDHWHYNIDLIESYLAIYPDKLEEVLFKKEIFTFYDNPMIVMPRKEKYVLFEGQPRQLNSVYIHPHKKKVIEARKEPKYVVRINYGKGPIYKTTLISKLLTLVANKYSLLDPECIGIEMEADRPNWCDALNGLPGLFGSSTAETLELLRLIRFLLRYTKEYKNKVKLFKELLEFLDGLKKISVEYLSEKIGLYEFWDKRHNILEKYRQKTLFGILGKEINLDLEEINRILEIFIEVIEKNLPKAYSSSGMIYTYFENKVVKYKKLNKKNYRGYECIWPLEFKSVALPYFLEGNVHLLRYLREINDFKKSKEVNEQVIKSELFDKKLRMLKINAPLDNVDIHVGRIKVFTPGWLENESIWLHMEYKYLLELLRNNLSEEFWSLAKTCLVPFMNPLIYGRSIFENSSFIVSSAHPEKEIHGQGFVGRLSGSTAEFLSMWIAITSGLKPFYVKYGKLYLKFQPQLPGWLFLEDGSFEFKFLGEINVKYLNPSKKNTYGDNKAKIFKIVLFYKNGKSYEINSDEVFPNYSYDVRDLKIKRIEVYMR
ncbi:MAG: hypothetical protein QXO40_04650 [Candidatus Aenigmatarchaeota archaeon]